MSMKCMGTINEASLNKNNKPSIKGKSKIVTDPNGSYTGRPLDPNDRPVQDADDL